MARYRYDVDKITRLIDVHKSFQGGLKTVDTDEALKDFYLREAENVSLSEFSFVEKRYGLHKNSDEDPWSSIENASSKLQGYFEYYVDADTVDKIIVFEGRFYVNRDGNGYEEVLLFDTPTGEAIDLSSLGVYTNQDIENVTLNSYSAFADQAPLFFNTTSEMNASSHPSGTVCFVEAVDSHYSKNVGAGWSFITGSTGVGTYPVSFTQDKYYKDQRTNKIYQWENATGFVGQLTLVTSIYDADIQSTRPVEGVRIDDKLYIATGTYPVYYKGDGKIYVFEQYQMSDLDVQNLGYDLNSTDLDKALFDEKFLEKSSTHGLTDEDNETYQLKNRLRVPTNLIAIKEGVIDPLIPYVLPSVSGETTFKAAWHLYNNSAKDFYSDFNSQASLPSNDRGSWTTLYGQLVEPSTGNFRPYQINNEYIVRFNIERKPAGALVSSYETIEITEDIVFTNDSSALAEKRLPQSSSDSLNNIVLKAKNDVSGNFDFRIKASFYKKGYKAVLVKWKEYGATEGLALWNSAPSNRKLDLTTVFGTFTDEEEFIDYANDNWNAWASAYGAQDTDGTVVARGTETGTGNYFYAIYDTILNDFREGDDFANTYPFLNSSSDPDNIQEILISEASIEFLDVWITPEKLEDYLEEPYTSLKVHDCNRITEHNGRLCLFGSTTHLDWLFFSTVGAKNYFPYGYALQFTNELKEEITAVTKFMNILVVQSPSYTWGIRGDVPLQIDPLEGETYRKITINPTIGCIAPKSVKNVRNQVYFLSKEGVFTLRALYAEDSRYNVDPIDRNIYNIVPRDTDAVCAYFDDQYWLHFPQSGMTLRYYVDKKAWVKDTYSCWNLFGGIHKYINESGVLRFITNPSQFEENDDLKIFDVDIDYNLPSDLGLFFESKMTTSFLNQDYPFHPKNYKEAKLEFTLQNEYNIGKEPIYAIEGSYGEGGTSPTQYILFDANLTKRHFYQITLDKVNVPTSSTYTIYVNNVSRATGTFTETDPVSQSWLPIEFQILDTDTMPCEIKIVSAGFPIVGGELTTVDESVAVLKDSTYDNSITFTNVILSEEGTLNIDPISSYEQSAIERVIDLGTRLGNWTFGTSDFGNVITAVETIKLSGKGYNCKISITETGKSKWTLESLGITYKMKKARSR